MDPRPRLLVLDGMRGVAALSVLVFHLVWNSAGADVLQGWLPDAVVHATGNLRSGVAIFLVISGFVIALTTRCLARGAAAGSFAVRRQVRLDPPYYVAIVAVLMIEYGQSLVPGLEARELTPVDVLFNLLYLQDVAGAPSVLAVAWTLCLEVQFYLVVVALALASSRLSRRPGEADRIKVGAASVLALVSLTLPLLGLSAGPCVLGPWWMFALGMMLAWHVDGLVSGRFVAVALGGLVAWATVLQVGVDRADAWGGEWCAIATGAVVAFLSARGGLTASPGALLLYLGRISYSLYLVHLPLIGVVSGLCVTLAPDRPVLLLLAAVAGGLLSIGAAEILHQLVERPAISWSRRLKTSTSPRRRAAVDHGS